MNHKIRKIGIGLLAVLWLTLSVSAWFAPHKDISHSERRPLQQFPPFTADSLFGGNFMEKFGDYTLDQFPLRDDFRTVKSLFAYYLLGQKDNNGIYLQDGYAAKLEYPLSNVSVNHALSKFNFIYENYLKNTDSQIYLTVIPDKGYYLAEPNGYPAMDYEALFAKLETGMPWANMVDITATLDITDYYRTDTHWRQEKLTETANLLCQALGVSAFGEGEQTVTTATQKFYGVYYGQAALPMKAESLYILENELLSACRVYNHETKTYTTVYDLQKLNGLDPYDVYLSGPQALLTVENPNATTDRELILFRDSFGSSLAPLLVKDYKTITLVDIRYISSQMLGEYLQFNGQDVLFAYSTLILNSSAVLK